ncbi:hypothetical protein SUGI_1188900 [Cryptomeria japonica]|uniref:transcription factor bHLH162-like n=1 Tax=Cryptomeria japonica TaxID=3369 RepID=UPI0024147904|nr:transcription factor bHLH162-like [Cryptomeria japonica]GLJ55378.1 hypothetical protein SUGI_1188900 [Cryptomeria japonica]
MNEFSWVPSTFSPCAQSGEHDHSLPLFNEDLCVVPAQPSKRSEGLDKQWRHKVIERQRRMDMKSRYSQLIALLPGKDNRGHISIADRLSEASDYISHLQEKVNELAKKRDEVKMKINEEKLYCYNKEDNEISFSECEAFPLVKVTHMGSRVEITTNTLKEQMVLSELIFVIEEQGLRILSSASFASDGNIFHTVHCKVLDTQSFKSDLILKQRLRQLIDQKSTPHTSLL